MCTQAHTDGPVGNLGSRKCRRCGHVQSARQLAVIAKLARDGTWQCEVCAAEHVAW